MVHSWGLKKDVSLIPISKKEELTNWNQCRDYLKITRPEYTKKLKNWGAQILYKKLKINKKSLFDYYYSKLLLNKNPKKWDKYGLIAQKTTPIKKIL